MPKERKYDRALLDETFARDNASHDETKELPTRLNSTSRIPFKCACGTPNIRVFRKMVDHGGARCEPCTKHNAKLKRKATCLENHGVGNPSQSAEVRKKVKATCLENHGVENPMQSAEVREKAKATCLENHGVEHPLQSAEFKEKAKATNLENNDVEWPMQSAEVREKAKATCIENHGVENPSQSAEVKDKMKATCLEKYDCENPFQNAEFKEKAKATMLENHGVENPMQSSEILERSQKNALKRKDFTTPSGEVWSLQGYEPLVAPKLIDEYGEDDITPDLKQVPQIPWKDSKGVRHKYYCDFYVRSHKIIVEVKSLWTETKDTEKIEATREAANALGYGYRLIVLGDRGNWIRDELSPPVIHSEV